MNTQIFRKSLFFNTQHRCNNLSLLYSVSFKLKSYSKGLVKKKVINNCCKYIVSASFISIEYYFLNLLSVKNFAIYIRISYTKILLNDTIFLINFISCGNILCGYQNLI